MAEVTRALIGLARRVTSNTKAVVDSHEDPLYRNNIMVYVSQLNKGRLSKEHAFYHLIRKILERFLYITLED